MPPKLTAALTIGFAIAWAGDAVAQPAVRAVDRRAARELFRIAESTSRGGDDLWGVKLYGPMLFVDPASRQVVANTRDEGGVLEEIDGGLFAGVLPDDLPTANTAVDWGGRRWTMLLWPVEGERYAQRVLLVHEMFHRIQPQLGHAGADAVGAHLESALGRLTLRLEWRALQAAISASGSEREAAVRDALAFRRQRHAAFPEGAVRERRLELNEGLAEYTGVWTAIPEIARAGWVLDQLDEHESQSRQQSIVRTFAYASGPAYGLLLDDAADGWRSRLSASSDLGSMLAAASGIPLEALEGRATSRIAAYGGELLAAEEAARERARAEQQEAFRRRFEAGPLLELPADPSLRYSFNPSTTIAFDDSRTIHRDGEVKASWGSLSVATGGFLLERTDGSLRRVVLPAPTEAAGSSASGDGWQLELAAGWRLVPGARPGHWTAAEDHGKGTASPAPAPAPGIDATSAAETAAGARSLALRVRDLPAMERFYAAVLGARFVDVGTGPVTSRFADLAGFTLKLVPLRGSSSDGEFPLHQPGFTVPDVEAALLAAASHGGSQEGEVVRRDGKKVGAALRDPEGNTIEIYAPSGGGDTGAQPSDGDSVPFRHVVEIDGGGD